VDIKKPFCGFGKDNLVCIPIDEVDSQACFLDGGVARSLADSSFALVGGNVQHECLNTMHAALGGEANPAATLLDIEVHAVNDNRVTALKGFSRGPFARLNERLKVSV
jgi:hypothetical protein